MNHWFKKKKQYLANERFTEYRLLYRVFYTPTGERSFAIHQLAGVSLGYGMLLDAHK